MSLILLKIERINKDILKHISLFLDYIKYT